MFAMTSEICVQALPVNSPEPCTAGKQHPMNYWISFCCMKLNGTIHSHNQSNKKRIAAV